MAIFNFLKKKKEQPKLSIKIEELAGIIENEEGVLNAQLDKFKEDIKSDVLSFSSGLKSLLPAIESVDLEKRKENEKLKQLVLESKNLYLSFLKKMILDFKNLDSKDAKEYLSRAQAIFNTFSNNSHGSFERATILIGKELGGIREKINEFARNFNEKIRLNSNFDKLALLEKIKSSLKSVMDTEILIEKAESSAKLSEENLLHLENQKKSTEKEIEEYKKSPAYQGYLSEQKRIVEENNSITRNLMEFKQKIDFRGLSKFFHGTKKMHVIKEYSENFRDKVAEDSSLEIIGLIRQANQNIDEFELNSLRIRLLNKKEAREDKNLAGLEEQLNNLEECKRTGEKKVEQERNRVEKFKENKKETLNNLRGDVRKMWGMELEGLAISRRNP
jgi:hypothetical protein